MADGDLPPPGWEKLLDPQSKRYYYVNHELKVRSWVNPGVLDQDSDSSPQAPQHQPAGGATRVAVINTGGFMTGAQRRYSGQAALATAERDFANKLSPRVEFVPLEFAPVLAGPPALARRMDGLQRSPSQQRVFGEGGGRRLVDRRREAMPWRRPREIDGLQKSPSPERVPAFRSPLLAPRGGSEPPKSAVEQAAENELAARLGSRLMDGLQRRDVANMPLHASSPGVLQAHSRRGGSPIMSGDLHSSHRSAYEPALRPLSYTEELTGKAERERRTYPAGKALRATSDQLSRLPLSRFPDAREETPGRYFTDAPVQDARLARSLEMLSTLPSRWMDNPSLSYQPCSTLLRNRGSHEWPGRDNYQRAEDYLSDSMRHGGARAAEMNQLRSEFSSKQRELVQELNAAYRHSQAQCDDLQFKFQMLMANNQFLIEHIQNSGQSAHPTQTLRSSNGAMTVANTRTSMSEQEGLVQMCVYFHEQIQQAQAMAQQERLRNTYLANQLLGLQMQQRQTQWSTDKPVDRHNAVQAMPATNSSSPKEVSPEMLIDQYLGVYGDPSPRVPNGVVPKNDQYLRVYGDHLSPPHKIGETVEALYCNGQWYTAQIKSRVEGSPDTFEVAWSDGDSNDTIKHKSNIRRPNSGPSPRVPNAVVPKKIPYERASVGAISVQEASEPQLVPSQCYVEELSSVDPSETDLDSVETSNLTSRTPSVPRMGTQQEVWGNSDGAEIVDNSGPSLFGEPLFKGSSAGPSLFGEPLFNRN